MDRWIMIGISAFGVVVTIASLWICYILVKQNSEFAYVAVLILVGIAAFVGIMNLLSFTAYQIKILTPGQAFGLPDGSVRAILTMAFIVLVGVLASYLVTRPDNPPYSKEFVALATCVSQQDANEIKKQGPSGDGIIVLVPCKPGSSAGSNVSAASGTPGDGSPNPPSSNSSPSSSGGGAAASGGAGGALYDVRMFPRMDHRLSEDISKQILTMLSTILAAMIGFYFGGKQTNVPTPPTPGNPPASSG
jgi:hypothetical protein